MNVSESYSQMFLCMSLKTQANKGGNGVIA